MPTTVHIPKSLLEAVDRKARTLQLSRNRFIVTVLEQELADELDWTPGFFERLEQTGPQIAEDVDEMLNTIHARRSTKPPPKL